ncbi:hypothetical protein [Aquimarina sediminis]|uniref:hypothetical protein n=1 Tax=Aquimarina sediminis TaxID=2070536 RepID=UPI000CA01F75|nr:hypothetical protein [Aquimarina sediminis]
MKKIVLFLFIFPGIIFSQLDQYSVMGLPTAATNVEMNGVTGATTGSILYNLEESKIFVFDGTNWVATTNDNWLVNGNTGLPTSSFLGHIDDVKMEIRSNNLPLLQFGRRQTLGLTQGFPDYTDNDQPMVHVNGDGNTSAIQFAASGASFYKPMFFTTTNGSFRLKGSTGGTDLFEIGSAGPANDGKLEFIIGDDGPEPIVFKRYDYRRGQFHREFFRVQGSNGTADATTRFGINLNPQEVPVDSDYDDPTTGYNVANSTLQLEGSFSTSILSTTGNLTLTENHHTIHITGAHNITLPNANTCQGRTYILKNSTNANRTISTYRDLTNSNQTTILSESVLWIKSDGTLWQQINSNGSGSSTVSVDQSFVWAGQVNDNDIHSNGTLQVNQTRADTGWSFANPSTISYTGSPDHVRIDLMAVANNTGNHWAHPHIRVFRNGTQIGEGSGLHMDDSGTYSGRTTTVISMIDQNPGTNPVYTFTTLEDDSRTMNNATTPSLSPVSLVAIQKVTVSQSN